MAKVIEKIKNWCNDKALSVSTYCRQFQIQQDDIKRITSLMAITFLMMFFQNCDPVGQPDGKGNSGADQTNNVLIGGGSSNPGSGGSSNPPQNGGGGNNPPLVITGNPPPPNPTSLRMIVNGMTSVSLAWDSGGGSTAGYRVVFNEGTTAPSNCNTGVTSVGASAVVINNLTKAKQYSFRVCAINGNTSPDISSGMTLTTGTRCFQNPAPTITNSSFAGFSFPMGMGPISGTAQNIPAVSVSGANGVGLYDPATQAYVLRCTTSPANILGVSCGTDNGTGFQNNSVKVDFTQAEKTQCPPTGVVTVSLVARDECGAESPAKTISVNVTNECVLETKVTAQQKAQNDQFGSQVAIEGNYAVAIETGDNEGGQDSGAANVYFFDGSSWVFQQKLIPRESAMSDNMKSVAISGNRIVVGSPYHPTAGVGAVFVFERSGSNWSQSATLTPSQPNVQDVGDLYGYAVALSGTRLVVGAPWDNNVETAGNKLAYAGAVYVYNFNGLNWIQEGEKVVVPGNTARNEFGASLSLGPNYIVVGAPHNESFRTNGSGKVHVLTQSGGNWVVSKTLEASNKKNGDMFGMSVATDGTRVAVGAPFATGKADQSAAGAVYVFDVNTWTQTSSVFASDGANNDRFGTSVAIVNDDLAVGSPWNETKTGAVYQFKSNSASWPLVFKIMARDRQMQDEFGASISLSNRRLFVGSRLDDDSAAENAGAGYFISLK